MANKQYNAEAIEVLTGLDPVKKRPGMYTDTTRPNHLAQEIIDNSVDEAIAGHADNIEVILHKDASIEVSDNGRGMPTDMHPKHKVPGVELILTRLHAGAKFSSKNYKFSGGLHGVGAAVVNALSKKLEVVIKRDGNVHFMEFADGNRKTKLKKISKVKKSDTGTVIRFWPDPKYFDTAKILSSKLKHLLQAKAVLCPGLCISFSDHNTDETTTWQYNEGLVEYLAENISGNTSYPELPFSGQFQGNEEEASFALSWTPEKPSSFQESYVNLIPTAQGGTHVNGLRTGLLEAIREFCEIQNLLPRGVKIAPDDIWENLNFVLSVKLLDPQFAGQTKEKLASRQCASFVSGVIKDSFSLWLNQHVTEAKKIAEFIIEIAQRRLRTQKSVARKKVTQGPALPGKLADCTLGDSKRTELFLVEGDSAGGSAKQARDKEFQAVMPLRGKILNTWEIDQNQILASKEVHDIAVAIGVDPGNEDLSKLRYGKICILADADSDGMHIATLLCALFVKHFPALVKGGHVYVAQPPLYRIDANKNVYYALDEAEKQGVMDRIKAETPRAKVHVLRFKGLGEMNPMQLRETTMTPDTRKLLQLTIKSESETIALMDMLLAKKRASDRKTWLEDKGDLVSTTI